MHNVSVRCRRNFFVRGDPIMSLMLSLSHFCDFIICGNYNCFFMPTYLVR